jgi:hypothetical protein
MNATRISLIRFLTARQAELRGLRTAWFSLTVCVIIALLLTQRAWPKPWGFVALVSFWAIAQGDITHRIRRWYDARYGRVDTAAAGQSTIASRLMALGVALDVTRFFPFEGHSAFPLLLGVYGTWIAVRDRPWRSYYAALVLVAAWAPAVSDPTRMRSFLPAYAAALAALGLAGVLDHLLLARLVKAVRQPDPSKSAA